jgi:hypothetical protein
LGWDDEAEEKWYGIVVEAAVVANMCSTWMEWKRAVFVNCLALKYRQLTYCRSFCSNNPSQDYFFFLLLLTNSFCDMLLMNSG